MTSANVEAVELLPCPFCGGEAYHPTVTPPGRGPVDLTVVWCRGCEVEMHNGPDAIPIAAEMWNTRPSPAQSEQREAYRRGLADAAKEAQQRVDLCTDLAWQARFAVFEAVPAAILALANGDAA